MTTPSTLGPKALPNSGCRIGVDSNASSGRSRKHFIKCECGSSGEQFTWCETMAAYLAGSCTRDQGAKPEPDINIARWNSRPVWWWNIRVKLRLRLWIYNSKKKKTIERDACLHYTYIHREHDVGSAFAHIEWTWDTHSLTTRVDRFVYILHNNSWKLKSSAMRIWARPVIEQSFRVSVSLIEWGSSATQIHAHTKGTWHRCGPLLICRIYEKQNIVCVCWKCSAVGIRRVLGTLWM